MARSRRACPERSRRNPGDACWQMILRAFRPRTANEDKQSTSGEADLSRRAVEGFAVSLSLRQRLISALRLLTVLSECILDAYSHYAYSVTMADDVKALLPLQPTTFHILLSLTDEDRHGYAIILEVARRTQGELKLSAGTLYRSIQRMLETGLIVETRSRPAPEMDDERRRYYRITPLGKAAAEAEAGRLRDLLKMARLCGVAPRTT
jgi:DNA-binding PadR family transcriptional regulator